MASSVVSDNFETSTGAIPNMGGADVTTRLCSAWVNFDGTGTVAIRASYNVSSITDNGVGNYTVNFTTAMADANYVVSVNTPMYSATNSTVLGQVLGSGTVGAAGLKTTSQVSVVWGTVANPTLLYDPSEMYVTAFSN